MSKHYVCKIPLRTVSEANANEHWGRKYARVQIQKAKIKLLFWPPIYLSHQKLTIKLTRIGRRELDGDNLQSALKHVRDAVADKLIPGLAPGRADGDPRLTWEYNQCRANEYSVFIEIIPEFPEPTAGIAVA